MEQCLEQQYSSEGQNIHMEACPLLAFLNAITKYGVLSPSPAMVLEMLIGISKRNYQVWSF